MRECELMHTIVESVQQRGRHLEHTRLVRSHHHRCFSGICIETEEKYQHFSAIIPEMTSMFSLRLGAINFLEVVLSSILVKEAINGNA